MTPFVNDIRFSSRRSLLPALIGCAVAVSLLFLASAFRYSNFTYNPAGPPRNAGPGDRIPRSIVTGEANQTLILAVRVGCHFCESSMPFYRRLYNVAKTHTNPKQLRLLVVAPDSSDVARSYLRRHALDIDVRAEVPLKSLQILGTPTLILIDRTRMVRRVWIGQLDAKQENDLLSSIGML